MRKTGTRFNRAREAFAMAVTACSYCGKKYSVTEDSIGKRVKCRDCGHVFVARPFLPRPAPARAAAPAAAPPPHPPRRAVESTRETAQVQGELNPFEPDEGQSLMAAMESVEAEGGAGMAAPAGYGLMPPPLPAARRPAGVTAYPNTLPYRANAPGSGRAPAAFSATGNLPSDPPSAVWACTAVGILALGSFLVPAPYCYAFLVTLLLVGAFVARRAVSRNVSAVRIAGDRESLFRHRGSPQQAPRNRGGQCGGDATGNRRHR